MKLFKRTLLSASILGLLSSVSFSTLAMQAAGKTIIARGDVVASGGYENRQLKRRSPVFDVDVVRTGAKSRAQFRMTDGGMLALQENTELQISSYEYNPETDSGTAVMKLISGGIRTVTGKLKSENGDYKLETPVGSIGIRGTHYEIEIIAGELFIAVWDGAIDLTVQVAGGQEMEVPIGDGADFSYISVNEEGEVTPFLEIPENFSEGHASDPTEEEEEEDESGTGDSGNEQGDGDGDGDSGDEQGDGDSGDEQGDGDSGDEQGDGDSGDEQGAGEGDSGGEEGTGQSDSGDEQLANDQGGDEQQDTGGESSTEEQQNTSDEEQVVTTSTTEGEQGQADPQDGSTEQVSTTTSTNTEGEQTPQQETEQNQIAVVTTGQQNSDTPISDDSEENRDVEVVTETPDAGSTAEDQQAGLFEIGGFTVIANTTETEVDTSDTEENRDVDNTVDVVTNPEVEIPIDETDDFQEQETDLDRINQRSGVVSFAGGINDATLNSTAGGISNFNINMTIDFTEGAAADEVRDGTLNMTDAGGQWDARFAGSVRGTDLDIDFTQARYNQSIAEGDLNNVRFTDTTNGSSVIDGNFDLSTTEGPDFGNSASGSFKVRESN